MAVELESSNMSPRISFSHDFCQSDVVPVEQQHPFRSNSTGIDFDFCVRKSFDQESSSADELFLDGKILPTEVKKKKKKNVNIPVKQTSSSSDIQSTSSSQALMLPLPKDQGSKIMRDEAADNDLEEKQSSKSFWKFKRSSSLNCGSGYGRSLCPLPPLLSRSNSTGSASNDKRAALSKYGTHHPHKENNSQRQACIRSSSHSSSTSSASYLKPPLKKNYGSYGNGIQVNPVLNVPSANLFGLGSIFSKDKNKKK